MSIQVIFDEIQRMQLYLIDREAGESWESRGDSYRSIHTNIR